MGLKTFHAVVVEPFYYELNSKNYNIGDDIFVIDILGDKYFLESDVIDIIPRKNVRKVRKHGKKKINIKK
ncbi:hypothetical protein F398_gp03 [Clostridium phage phi24R]|uniref:Uncharacterized protein n=1 Tax=Clostridium phage phi24R TaxID=1128071 RepID=G9J3H0_9CAUD|nr:hypothetical protein F398_gp03 [Clostridium phage phi24R]AEW47835.1 hypothetical protein phi24R_gp3 [Clostridium phage phi24R]